MKVGRRSAGADGFRLLRTGGREPEPARRPRARTLAVVSGKGGVGKTTLVVNLAVALRGLGRRVLILDGDLGMGNADLLMGKVPRHTLHDVVLGERGAAETVLEVQDGIRLLAGSTGVEEMANLDDLRRERLLCSVTTLEEEADVVLIDTGPGLHRTGIHLARAADEVLVITTPEPTAFTDAYAILRVLRKGRLPSTVWMVVNQAHDRGEAQATAQKMKSIARRFLSFEPDYLGFVLEDPAVGLSVRRQTPLLDLYPDSKAARCVLRLAHRLIEGSSPQPQRIAQGGGIGSVAYLEDAPA